MMERRYAVPSFAEKLVLLGMLATLAGCAILSSRPVGNRNVPQPAKPVDLDRYLGRWYELHPSV
jgi:apolipoprotein D and lipocalin family protein